MSALSMIVGGWLLLNAGLLAALMLRRDQPALRDRLFRWVVDGERRRARRGPAESVAPKVIERETDISTEGVRYNRR